MRNIPALRAGMRQLNPERSIREGLLDDLQVRRQSLQRRGNLDVIVRRDHVAQGLQLGIRDLVELHPKLQNSERQQPRRIRARPIGQKGLTFFQSCKQRQQPFFRICDRHIFHSRSREVESRGGPLPLHWPLSPALS